MLSNLDTDRIGSSVNESLDLEILLQGFKEQFDLPSFSVNGCNGGGSELHLVGEQF
jgi:hypothetical protein